MGLLDCASGASVWRGYDYYKEKKVMNLIETDSGIFTADVIGTASEPYTVEINIEHPKRSRCNCPHADGRRIICKHMTAVYFAAYPKEAERVYNEAIAYEKEQEKRVEEISRRVVSCVNSMKKDELRKELLYLLYSCPDWLYDKFVRGHGLDEF